jgi:hypothetical protein
MRTVAWCGGHIERLDQTLLQREVRAVPARGRVGARLAQAEGWPAGQLEEEIERIRSARRERRQHETHVRLRPARAWNPIRLMECRPTRTLAARRATATAPSALSGDRRIATCSIPGTRI